MATARGRMRTKLTLREQGEKVRAECEPDCVMERPRGGEEVGAGACGITEGIVEIGRAHV